MGQYSWNNKMNDFFVDVTEVESENGEKKTVSKIFLVISLKTLDEYWLLIMQV